MVRGVPRIRSGRSSACVVDRIGARGRQQRAARGIAPRAGERRQAGHGAHRVAAAGDALHAVVHPDRRRARRAVVAGQRLHLRGRDAAGRGDARRRPLRGARGELLVADGVALDVVAVDQSVADKHVHQSVGERRVGARHQCDVLVALLGRRDAVGSIATAARRGAWLPARASRVQVGGDRVAAPDQDQPRLGEALDVHADRGTDDATQPALPAVAQIVRSRSDAPRRWKKRRSMEAYWSRPMLPA